MSTTQEAVKYEILPKRETRSKKRQTFEAKDTPNNNNNNSNNNNKNDRKSGNTKEGRRTRGKKVTIIQDDDDTENQGFTSWLRSTDGVDTMRLFVIANSILVFGTMAWPHIIKMLNMIQELIFGEDE